MPGEDPAAKPLASNLSQAARSFESKFAARRKKRLEETAAALAQDKTGADSPATEGESSPSAYDSDASASPIPVPDSALDDNAKRFLKKLSGEFPDETMQESEKPAGGTTSSSSIGKASGQSYSSTSEPSSPSSSPSSQSSSLEEAEFDSSASSTADSPAASDETGWHKVSDSLKSSQKAEPAAHKPEPTTSSSTSSLEDPEIDQRSTIIEKYSKKANLPKGEDPGWDQKSTIIEKFKPGDLVKRDEPDWDQKSTIIEKINAEDFKKLAKEKAESASASGPSTVPSSPPNASGAVGSSAGSGSLGGSGASGAAGSSGTGPKTGSLGAGGLGSSLGAAGLGAAGGSGAGALGGSLRSSLSGIKASGAAAGAAEGKAVSDTAASASPSQTDSTTRAGFKPRKDLSSYRSFDSGRGSSSALSGPGGSADAKLFGGMSSAPEDAPSGEPQTPEERKKALDAIGYKRGTELPPEVSGGPAPSAQPVKNDQFKPPTISQPSSGSSQVASSDVGWQSVPKDESKPKGGGFAAARRSQTLGPVEVAAAKKKEEEFRAAQVEKPKPYRGREEDTHLPKNRWGQVPDNATARSVWADQLGITKPAPPRGPSASLRGRLKRVMSADIFNVRELYSLRGIACLVVFIAQAQIFAAHAKPGYPINMIGAQIFFVMSGFVITRWLLVNEAGSLKRTLGEFYARRALRIFPMYYLVLVVLMLTGHLANAESFFCGLFNYQALQGAKVAPQLLQYWTLCVEMQFYMLFPLLLMVTPQRARMFLVILLTAGSTAFTYISAQQTPHAQDWLLLPISGQYILWGCLAAYMDVKSDIALSLNASGCVLIGIASQVALHIWLLMYSNVPTNDISDMLWKGLSTVNAISIAILIFGLWRTSNAWLRGLCANDVLVYFGKISYGFYILLPLCFLMQPSIIAVMPMLAKVPPILTSFVITFVMAVVTYHYLQSPVNSVREHLPIAR